MLNLFIKYFMLMNLMLMSFFSLFINDLMNIWFLMEINNFLFICYLITYMKNKKMIFFYFLIQIIPSMLLILSISINFINIMNKNIIIYLTYMGLLIKLGIPPFHLWMPILSLYLYWDMLFFLLTIQKIIPFYMLSLTYIEKYLMLFILISCSIIPPLVMFNLTNIKKLLTYSSINQTSWLMSLIYFKSILWILYLTFYSLMMMIMFFILSAYKIYYNFLHLNYNLNMFLLIMTLNMASTPPFMFFIMKWFSIFIMINNSLNLFNIMILMTMSSFIMFFLYINMMYLNMYINLIKSKLFYIKSSMKYFKLYQILMFFFITFFIPIIMII
uniref:NADH-ubiquinone oxidoreductase chain 2 n=1 Tax=Ochetellus glaber TaxID=255795 RepID=A0A6B9BK18_9HYME|nr:NADH dehydrogenase subunit 2 [Ochetellus glaber]QGW36341.1 NADH dehydrogenase subunit 2 [Ochetellus glaber]